MATIPNWPGATEIGHREHRRSNRSLGIIEGLYRGRKEHEQYPWDQAQEVGQISRWSGSPDNVIQIAMDYDTLYALNNSERCISVDVCPEWRVYSSAGPRLQHLFQ